MGIDQSHKGQPYEGDKNFHAFINEVFDGQGCCQRGYDVDLVARDPADGMRILFEFCYVHPRQYEGGPTDPRAVTPHTSHPNRFWHGSGRKFWDQWQLAKHTPDTKLVFVNYTDVWNWPGLEVRLIRVLDMDIEKGITKEKTREWNFQQFQDWMKRISNG